MKRLLFLFLTFGFLAVSCSDNIIDSSPMQNRFGGFHETSSFHNLKVTQLTFEGAPLPSGWEIGIYTWEGILGGAGVWNADSGVVISVYGADEETPQFRAGEYFDARIWDRINGIQFYADVDLYSGDRYWSADGQSKVAIDGFRTREMRIQLVKGWNIVSINVLPLKTMFTTISGPNIIRMLDQFEPDLIIAKDERGQFYMPSRQFNNIPYWNLSEGYQMKVSEAVECVWIGRPVKAREPIRIGSGWNMIGYFPEYPLSCDSLEFAAISSIVEEVTIAKDRFGRFAMPSRGFSNMIPWTEGSGYQINLDCDCSFAYREAEATTPSINPIDTQAVFGPWTRPRCTGVSKSLLIQGFSGIVPATGDAVGAFGSRSEVLVGLGHVGGGKAGIAIWGDDYSTEEMDGLMSGEAYTLKYWSAATNEIYPLTLSSLISGDGLIYETDGVTVIQARVQ